MMEQNNEGRGAMWLRRLANGAPAAYDWPAVQVCDAQLAGKPARFIAVVPDPANRFPRVRNGEVGLIEGWQLARAVQDVVELDREAPVKRPIVAVIDVPSQAYGRREEAYGIHQALAGAAGAYAQARLAGHPVIGLIVGLAMSGAFLAHGYQADRLIALDDPGVQVHAMEKLAASVPPMAYDIRNYASLGILWKVLQPGGQDPAQVVAALEAALADIHEDRERGLNKRLQGEHRQASRRVRALLESQWEAAD
jgi:malonate decarboxylase gamma subunit